jgi:hypothetical protein
MVRDRALQSQELEFLLRRLDLLLGLDGGRVFCSSVVGW